MDSQPFSNVPVERLSCQIPENEGSFEFVQGGSCVEIGKICYLCHLHFFPRSSTQFYFSMREGLRKNVLDYCLTEC